MYIGYPWQSTNLASLFLLLGVGIDDAFVMLNCWKRIKESIPERSIEEKMQKTYQDAALSITITSLTNILSFTVGTFLPCFKTVKIFCAYTTWSLLSVYILTLTFFGPLIVLGNSVESYFTEKDKEEDRGKDKSPVEEGTFENVREAQTITDGQNIVPQVNSSNSKSLLIDQIMDLLTAVLQNTWIRLFILTVWVCLTIFCSFQITEMKEGLERNRVTRYGSQADKYFKAEDEYFRVMNYRIHVVITGDNLDYGDAKVQESILKLLEDINNLPLISDEKALKEDWLSMYLKRCKKRRNINFKTNLLTCLRRYASKTPLRLNVKLSDDKSHISAVRFMFQSDNIKDATMDMELVRSLRQVADESSFNVTVFHPYFPFFDQFLRVWNNTLLCLGVSVGAVLLITFLLIPNVKACIILFLTISSLIVQVGGFMVLWDVSLDVISMILLIMGAGFSVGKF